jgi:tRNA (guanine-N7-)-methyltransferase
MTLAELQPQPRRIRSFVRREGRMTDAQKRSLGEHWPRYGLDAPKQPLDLAVLFGRRAPVVLEIGFGNGEHLLSRAQSEPQHDFLGVEVHRPGVGRLLMHAAETGIANLRVACDDAVEVLRDWLPESCLSEMVILFPDPWPKKRHHKRRLIQPPFVKLAVSRLVPGGRLQLATDWMAYAAHMREVLDAEPTLSAETPGEPATNRAPTKFERRGQRLGHAVFDLAYRRT